MQRHILGIAKGMMFEHLVAIRTGLEFKMRSEVAHAVTSSRIQGVFVLFHHRALCHQHFALAVRNDIAYSRLGEVFGGKFWL